MRRACHIIAIGARTPLGLTPESSAAAVRAGISRVEEHPYLVDAGGEPVRGARDDRLDPDLSCRERMVALARHALAQLAVRLRLREELSLPLLLAFPEFRPGFSDADAQVIQDRLAEPGGSLRLRSIRTVAHGHAGALAALHQVVQDVATSAEGACIVGGVDSWFAPKSLAWLARNGQLNGTNARSAFFPGEGACFLAVATEAACRRHGWSPLATLSGTGVAVEQARIKTEHDNLGVGLSEAIREACQGLDESSPVSSIYCDINGERYRAEEWGLTILRTSRLYSDPSRYIAPAGQWGDLGATTGAALTMLAVAAWQRNYAWGRRALLFAGSESGLRAATLIEQSAKS